MLPVMLKSKFNIIFQTSLPDVHRKYILVLLGASLSQLRLLSYSDLKRQSEKAVELGSIVGGLFWGYLIVRT